MHSPYLPISYKPLDWNEALFLPLCPNHISRRNYQQFLSGIFTGSEPYWLRKYTFLHMNPALGFMMQNIFLGKFQGSSLHKYSWTFHCNLHINRQTCVFGRRILQNRPICSALASVVYPENLLTYKLQTLETPSINIRFLTEHFTVSVIILLHSNMF